jgi:hypothetical protein
VGVQVATNFLDAFLTFCAQTTIKAPRQPCRLSGRPGSDSDKVVIDRLKRGRSATHFGLAHGKNILPAKRNLKPTVFLSGGGTRRTLQHRRQTGSMSSSSEGTDHPSRNDARRLCEKYDEDQIVIFFVNRDTKEMGNAFYGATEDLLQMTQEMVEVLYKHMKSYVLGNA